MGGKRDQFYHYDKPYVFLRDVDVEPSVLGESVFDTHLDCHIHETMNIKSFVVPAMGSLEEQDHRVDKNIEDVKVYEICFYSFCSYRNFICF